MSNIIFDGPNKLMVVASGIVELDAEVDIYSDWKEWLLEGDNSKYLQALRTVGGDPTVGAQSISPYYFLLNGWRIRPYEGDHMLAVEGNLFVDGGGNPFVSTVGAYNVLVNLSTSVNAVTDVVTASGIEASVSEEDKADIVDGVWDEAQSEHVSAGTFGKYLDSEVSEAGGDGLTTSGIADAVWDEILADHQGIGSTAEALDQAATASGLPAEITEQDKLDIADRVWDELTTGHTISGTFGKRVVDIYGRVDIAQAEVNDPTPTTTKFISTLTETMTGFWARGALIFTSGNNSGIIRGIKNYDGATKEIQVQTPLSYPLITGDKFSIIPARKFLTSDIEDIVDGIWDEAASEHEAAGSFGKLVDSIADNLVRTLGLTQENYYLDNTVYTEYQGAKLLTSGRLRIYSNAGSVGTSSDVIATYQITSVWTNDELDTYKVVKQ